MSRHYATDRDFRQALNSKVAAAATRTGRTNQQVQRSFLHQRLLAGIFDPTGEPDSWILKGGTGILIRIPEARPTKTSTSTTSAARPPKP